MKKEQYLLPTRKQISRMERVYTNLSFSSFDVVPNTVNLLIDDIGLDPKQRGQIEEQINRQIIFLEPSQLTKQLPTDFSDSQITIFPLNGGAQVKKSLNLPRETKKVDVSVKRDPKDIITGRIMGDSQQMLDLINDLKPETIRVADDVCVTGSTFRSIQSEVESKMNKSFYWILSIWLLSFPPKSNKSPSGVYGVRKTEAAKIYAKESGGNTPLNSLSTWFFDQEKGPIVLNSYANKYGSTPQNLINTISEIRSQL